MKKLFICLLLALLISVPAVAEDYVFINAASVNARETPDLNGTILSVLHQDDTLIYMNEWTADNRDVIWYKVLLNGNTGWVSSRYATLLSSAEEENTAFITLPAGTEMRLDLDADGTDETIYWRFALLDEYDTEVVLNVDGSEYHTGQLLSAGVYFSRVDSDDRYEIFISGDEMSDDFITFCLHYENGNYEHIWFEDAFRGDNNGGFLPEGYGYVTQLGPNCVVLRGTQDVLGTHSASRSYTLTDGRFEFSDSGLWYFDPDVTDPEVWEYAALTLKHDLHVHFYDKEGTLHPGDKLLVVSSDKQSIVWFQTSDDRGGYFEISPRDDDGYGFFVDGIPEEDMFEYLPYAD